jgi:hypothetical protein
MTKLQAHAVGPGMASNERAVEIRTDVAHYTLLAPEHTLCGDLLDVEVIAWRGDRALVDLPRETFTSGRRISVPVGMLVGPAAPGTAREEAGE